MRYFVVYYYSCLGTIKRTDGLMHRNNALAIVQYLKNYTEAYPLYMVGVKYK